MKALRWYGKEDVRVEEYPDPQIEHPRDAIIKVHLSSVCGSDMHLIDGFVPTMQRGDIIGHIGKTGRATGPHLHWGMNWFQAKLDPSRSTRTPAPPRA